MKAFYWTPQAIWMTPRGSCIIGSLCADSFSFLLLSKSRLKILWVISERCHTVNAEITAVRQ